MASQFTMTLFIQEMKIYDQFCKDGNDTKDFSAISKPVTLPGKLKLFPSGRVMLGI